MLRCSTVRLVAHAILPPEEPPQAADPGAMLWESLLALTRLAAIKRDASLIFRSIEGVSTDHLH